MSDELTKVADDLDSFVHDMREDGNDDSALWLEQRASALRRIAAAGEHKPQPGWDRGELLECAQWLEHGASLAVSAASKEQGELAARALREFAEGTRVVCDCGKPACEKQGGAIIGGTALCGHGVMAAICEICNRPSDRPADVTVEELADFLYDSGFIIVADDEEEGLARALLNAFTVGRR